MAQSGQLVGDPSFLDDECLNIQTQNVHLLRSDDQLVTDGGCCVDGRRTAVGRNQRQSLHQIVGHVRHGSFENLQCPAK